MAPIIAAALAASAVRTALMSHRERSTVPQSPGVAVAMWICQPSWESRASVPPQRISASSGWARRDRAMRGGAAWVMAGVGL